MRRLPSKAIVCQQDEYLLQLIRYIHLNPVRAGMVKEPEQYDYSGHRAYVEGKATEVIDPRKVLGLMGGKASYRTFIRDGIKDGHKEEYYDVQDALYKVFTADEIKEFQGFPTAVKRTMVNVKTGHKTEVVFERVQYEVGLGDDLFSERYLRRPPERCSGGRG